MAKYSIAIIGASGYTGSELVRILSGHPNIQIAAITSETHRGKRLSEIHPQFSGVCDQQLDSVDDLDFEGVDVAFLALPHGVSMQYAERLLHTDTKVVDLSGDFRLSSAEVYQSWYKQEHICPALIDSAVYGLPEWFADNIKDAKLIANPGCFPTSAILPLAPLVKKGLIETDDIVIDSKSGVSGAGAKAKPGTHFPFVSEGLKAYGIATHQHTPEIEEALEAIGKQPVQVQFTPHLVPMNRGILSTIYVKPNTKMDRPDLLKIYMDAYSDCPFVRVLNNPPLSQHVRGSNYCDLYFQFDPRTGRLLLISTIDNLVKGAAGQAVQNMNLMLGENESTGLLTAPLAP